MIEPLTTAHPRVLGFVLTEKLHDEDYKTFVPAVEKAIEKHGKVRILALMKDFHGWDVHAMWDDFKFGAHHAAQIERVAMVGDKQWESWMAKLCQPFMPSRVKYFDASELDAAWVWVGEGL